MVPVVTTAIQGAMAASAAFNMIGKAKEVSKDVNKALTAVDNFAAQQSLTDIVKMTRVEPETIIDQSCLHIEYLPDVLQTTLNIFTGYYLQALSIYGTINSTKVIRTLSALNPTASNPFGLGFEDYHEGSWKSSQEAYTFRLPKTHGTYAQEALPQSANSKTPVNTNVKGASAAPKLNELTREVANLAVGKLINVSMSDSANSDSKVTIPVTVRLSTNAMSTNTLVSMLSSNKVEDTFKERYHGWRAGRIEFWKDLVMCQDMIDNRKKILMDDKDGTYQRILKNANYHRAAGLVGDKSVAQSSNIVVMSEDTARQIEQKSGFQFKNATSRAKLFEAGYMMLMVIIDPQYERITFYHRGVAAPTNVGVRDIKMSNKNGGPDVTDIMKLLLQGSPVNI